MHTISLPALNDESVDCDEDTIQIRFQLGGIFIFKRRSLRISDLQRDPQASRGNLIRLLLRLAVVIDPLQAIAISRNVKAFSDTSVVARMLRANLQPLLEKFQLHLEIEALFERRAFWSLVEQYKGKIQSVTFELVSPNMANISKTLEIDLGRLNRETNSHRTDVKLNSDEGAALEITEGNSIVEGLVTYASEGGGDIALRIRGYKKLIRTSKSVREVTVDEFVLKNPTGETLKFIRDLFR